MQKSLEAADERQQKRAAQRLSRARAGRVLVAVTSLLFALVLLTQILHTTGAITAGFSDWRPILYVYLLWGIAFGIGQVLIRGEHGLRALFLLPAVLFSGVGGGFFSLFW